MSEKGRWLATMAVPLVSILSFHGDDSMETSLIRKVDILSYKRIPRIFKNLKKLNMEKTNHPFFVWLFFFLGAKERVLKTKVTSGQ